MSVLKLLKLEIPKDTMKKIKSLIVGIIETDILILISLAISSITLITLLYLDSLILKEAESLDYSSYENILPEYQTIIEYIEASTKNTVIDMLPLAHVAAILAAVGAGISAGVTLARWLNQRHYEKEIKENDKSLV
jgi:hypothetical protein